jgi:hypothetical protein
MSNEVWIIILQFLLMLGHLRAWTMERRFLPDNGNWTTFTLVCAIMWGLLAFKDLVILTN